jgi:hypothetical protein
MMMRPDGDAEGCAKKTDRRDLRELAS